MAQFHEAFIFVLPGDELDRKARAGELARTEFIPVSDAHAAVTVAADVIRDGVDLIELYGGLGPQQAAPIIANADGAVPVGLVGVQEGSAARNRAVIFAAPSADPATDRYVFDNGRACMTIVAIPEPGAAPAAATSLVDEGIDHIEVCGGLGPLPAARVIDAVGGSARVGSVMFGFESLPAVASYRQRFESALARTS